MGGGASAAAGVAAAVNNSTPADLQAVLASLTDAERAQISTALGVAPSSGGNASATAPACANVARQRRVAFTKQVDEALAKGKDAVKALLEEVCSKRLEVVKELRSDHSKTERAAKVFMQTLLHEQAAAMKNLVEAGDGATSVWNEKEVRFCESEAKCGKAACAYGSGVVQGPMLVVTPLSRTCRQAYFQAVAEKKVLVFKGPAGTGKTETIKDTAAMLGKEAIVINCAPDAEVPRKVRECAPNDALTPLILDEFNRLTKAEMEAISTWAKEQAVFLCLTLNPSQITSEVAIGDLFPQSLEQDMTIPPFDFIFNVMLGSEGFATCDEAGPRVKAFMDACKEEMEKKDHYDWGMRSALSFVRAAGVTGRQDGFKGDEKNLLATTALSVFWPRCTVGDREKLKGLVAKHLCVEVELPSCLAPGDNRWATTASHLGAVAMIRHGAMLINVTGGDVDDGLKAVEEAAKKADAQMLRVPGTLADTSKDDLFGKVSDNTWTDGAFTKTMRDAKEKTWITVVCGDMDKADAEKLECFNTLLDDNKILTLMSNERIPLPASNRVIFLSKDCSVFSPATVSRLGIVWSE